MPACNRGVLASGAEVALSATCSCGTTLDCLRWRSRERDADRRNPQEFAIAGPEVYPMSAPAAAPTGPNTSAPDTAPSAASVARYCALASNETSEPAIRAPISSFFTAIPFRPARGTKDLEITATPRCRRARLRSETSPRSKNLPAASFLARASIPAMMRICR